MSTSVCLLLKHLISGKGPSEVRSLLQSWNLSRSCGWASCSCVPSKPFKSASLYFYFCSLFPAGMDSSFFLIDFYTKASVIMVSYVPASASSHFFPFSIFHFSVACLEGETHPVVLCCFSKGGFVGTQITASLGIGFLFFSLWNILWHGHTFHISADHPFLVIKLHWSMIAAAEQCGGVNKSTNYGHRQIISVNLETELSPEQVASSFRSITY